MTIPINALITAPRGLSSVCLCGCVRPSCDVRLVSAQHRWVYLAARHACNLPTLISLPALFFLSSFRLLFCSFNDSSTADHNDSQPPCVYSVESGDTSFSCSNWPFFFWSADLNIPPCLLILSLCASCSLKDDDPVSWFCLVLRFLHSGASVGI